MTVKELMAELAKYPEDMEVFVVHQKQSCGMMRPPQRATRRNVKQYSIQINFYRYDKHTDFQLQWQRGDIQKGRLRYGERDRNGKAVRQISRRLASFEVNR